MSSSTLPDIPSFRKQHLLLEFASLKARCPAGIYLSLTPGDPSKWSGVIFVREGPYLPAVLRFNISFPSRYPDLPPLVTFVSEIFHPLLVPLTTYTFSSGASDAYETVSASDEERLPPGGFSLRHGFPQWFGRKSRGPQGVMSVDTWHSHNGHQLKAESTDVSAEPVPESLLDGTGTPYQTSHEAAAEHASIVEVLNYLKSAFQDPMMLDELPLEAAADPGAWHAWRSHRGFSKGPRNAINSANDERSQSLVADLQIQPNDWNWEGVWKNRVKIGIENSLSDPVLHGPKGGRGGDKRTELIRFSKMNNEQLKGVHEKLIEQRNESRQT